MKRYIGAIALFLLLTPGAGFAASKEQQEMQRDIAQLQDQVRTLQSGFDQKMSAIETLLQQTLDAGNKANTSVSVLSSSVSQTPRPGELKDALRPVAGLTAKVDNINNDVSDVRNSMADLTTQINRLQQQLTDINNAIKVMQAPAAAAPPSNLSPDAAVRSAIPPAKTLYDNATNDYNSGKADLALSDYAEFLLDYPDDPLAPEAQFFIGVIHLGQSKYDLAVADFDAILERYPEGKRTPDAYFMKGKALSKAGHRDEAATVWRALRKKYPRSDQADQAAEQLRAMGLSTGPATGRGSQKITETCGAALWRCRRVGKPPALQIALSQRTGSLPRNILRIASTRAGIGAIWWTRSRAFSKAEYLGRLAAVRYSLFIGRREVRRNPRLVEDQLRELEPGNRLAPADVEDPLQIPLQQIDRTVGQQRRIGRRRNVILHHANRLSFARQPQHQLGKIAARRAQPARPEHARRPHNQRPLQISLYIKFTGEFRNRISAQRMCRIGLEIGPAQLAVEHVVGRKMYQSGVVLAARESYIPNAQRVGFVSGERFPFGDIHLVVGGGIEDRPRIEFGQRALHLLAIADVQLFALEAAYFISAPLQLRAQLHAQLPERPKTTDSIRQGPILPVELEVRPVGAKNGKQDRGQHEHQNKSGPRQPWQARNRAQCRRILRRVSCPVPRPPARFLHPALPAAPSPA